jgi:hypothetical protein
MANLASARPLQLWTVRGRSWLRGEGDPTVHELNIGTRGAEDAAHLAHKAIEAAEAAPPVRVVVDSLACDGPLWIWSPADTDP